MSKMLALLGIVSGLIAIVVSRLNIRWERKRQQRASPSVQLVLALRKALADTLAELQRGDPNYSIKVGVDVFAGRLRITGYILDGLMAELRDLTRRPQLFEELVSILRTPHPGADEDIHSWLLELLVRLAPNRVSDVAKALPT